MKLHPLIVEKLIEGIRVPIGDYELFMFTNQHASAEYVFRKIRSKIESEVIADWRRVLGSSK